MKRTGEEHLHARLGVGVQLKTIYRARVTIVRPARLKLRLSESTTEEPAPQDRTRQIQAAPVRLDSTERRR